MGRLQLPTLEEIRAAAQRIAGSAVRTPLLRLDADDERAEIHLKLENLQPIGSFKIRGACNAMRLANRGQLARGVCTPSAGNMAQGVAWMAREMSVPCTVVVPDHAPQTKIDAVQRLGGSVVKLPFPQWWDVLLSHRYAGHDGFFVHPVSDPPVMAGNGTIGLEIIEDLPDADSVLIPWGGGGLCCGIAAAIRALKPDTRIIACEVETAAPLTASLQAGAPQTIRHTPSFIDGIGGPALLAEMWPLARQLVDDSIVVTLKEVASAIRLLAARQRIIAEGAGAVPLAAALSGRAGNGKIACVVSGGNLNPETLARILGGQDP